MFRRYAIYVVPDGDLGRSGAAWLGWDISAGKTVPHPDVGNLDLAALTKRPRKYGFHATIKPPMSLCDGTQFEDLHQAASTVAKNLTPVTLEALQVTRLGRFLALTPAGDINSLNALAAAVVTQLDPFRAPPTEKEFARRRNRPLSTSQERNLLEYGYPNVLEDFNFHITLTGPSKTIDDALPHVAAFFEPVTPTPYSINHLTIAGEAEDGMFHTVARLPLGHS